MLNLSPDLELDDEDRQYKLARLRELLLQKKRLVGTEDLWFFNKYILGYKDLTTKDRFHGELCKQIETPENKFTLSLLPRGSLKTSCGIGFAIQQVIKDPNSRGLIASEEFTTAQKILAEIKGHFETNATLINLYGNMVWDKKWNEKEIIVKTRTLHRKEPTITCAGIDVTKVGMHYDWIWIDDPHSSKNTTTREQLEKVKQWYKLLLSLLDPPKSRPPHLPPPLLRMTATVWHFDDLSNWIIERERQRKAEGRKKRFHIMVKSAVEGKLDKTTPDSKLLWPERLDREFLMDQLADQGPAIFSNQYRNIAVDDESAMFKRAWVQFYNPKEESPVRELVFTTLDPIRDSESADYAAIVTGSMGRDWVFKIREIRRGKWDDWEVLDQLIRVWRKWRPMKIGVESVAWQKVYYRWLKAESLRKGIHLPIMELKTDTRITKKMRIRSMVPYWKAGLFKVPGTTIPLLQGNMAIMVDELTRYPKVSNDDCVDALAYMDQLLQRPQVSAIIRKAPRNSFFGIREMNRGKYKKLGANNLVYARG